MQGFADGLATAAAMCHPTNPLVAHLDSLVVSLTELAGELAGIELWAGLEHSTPGRDFRREYAARIGAGR